MDRKIRTLFTSLKKEKLLTMSNIFVMMVTFLLLGFFVIVVAVSQTSLRYLEQQAQVTVFFRDDFTEDKIFELRSNLEKDQRISEVIYISKDEAFKIFTEVNKNEPVLLESITPSILPASLGIKTYKISDLSVLSDELSKNDGVEEIRFFQDVIERFRFWSTIVYVVGFVLVGLFLLISYSVIISTLRSTIHSIGAELEIMKLVGATDEYVKNPLVLQGVFYGFVSSFISAIVIITMGILAYKFEIFSTGLSFGFLPGISISPLIFTLILGLILILSGVVLGFVGSYTAVKKYLNY